MTVSFRANGQVRVRETVTYFLCSVHDGTAEPFRVTPPEAVAYYSSYLTFGRPPLTRYDSVVLATRSMQNRTQALRQLEEETRRARERLEGEARKSPDLWVAYQHWRTDGEPIGFRAWRDLEKRLNEAPELAHLWSSYLRLTADLKHALSRPSWPGILSEDDPTPPSGKRTV